MRVLGINELYLGLNLFLKRIVHQFVFYCSNLIFWIVMGCGIKNDTKEYPNIFVSTRGAMGP